MKVAKSVNKVAYLGWSDFWGRTRAIYWPLTHTEPCLPHVGHYVHVSAPLNARFQLGGLAVWLEFEASSPARLLLRSRKWSGSILTAA